MAQGLHTQPLSSRKQGRAAASLETNRSVLNPGTNESQVWSKSNLQPSVSVPKPTCSANGQENVIRLDWNEPSVEAFTEPEWQTQHSSRQGPRAQCILRAQCHGLPVCSLHKAVDIRLGCARSAPIGEQWSFLLPGEAWQVLGWGRCHIWVIALKVHQR